MQSGSTVDVTDILVKGGERRVALLRYCVMSVTVEPMFVFLTQEYRLRPTHIAALSLYDVFCAPDAPARVRALDLLPPRNLSLVMATEAIRQQWAWLQRPEQPEEGPTVSITMPHRNLFDPLAHSLQKNPDGHFLQLGSRYDPLLSAQQNLPGGKLNAAQRHFVDNVWRPVARPRLVAAGFWQVANIE
jgi:hypothetical protein